MDNEFGVTPRPGRSEVLFPRYRRSLAYWILLIGLVLAVAGFIFADTAKGQRVGYSLSKTHWDVTEGDVILMCVHHGISGTDQDKGAEPPSVRLTTRPAESGGAEPGKDYQTGPFRTRHNDAESDETQNQCACIPTIRDLEVEDNYKEFYVTIDPESLPEGAELSQVSHEARILIIDVPSGVSSNDLTEEGRVQPFTMDADKQAGMQAFCENPASPPPPPAPPTTTTTPPPPAPPTTTTTPRPTVTPPEPEPETEPETEEETEPTDEDEAGEETEVSEEGDGGCTMASAGAERGLFQLALAVFVLGAAVLCSSRFRKR